VRDCDAAGQAGLVFLLARPGVGVERFHVGGAALRDDARGELADDGALVADGAGSEAHEFGSDGLR